jgi:hypothetical protein
MLARHARPEPESTTLTPKEALRLPPVPRPLANVLPLAPCRNHMHPGVFKIAFLCWMMLLAVFWITFAMSANAMFMLAIVMAFATVYFGVPYLMSRISGASRTSSITLGEFLRGRFNTIYGPIGGLEALMQVILVPFAVSLGGIAIGFIIHAARNAH